FMLDVGSGISEKSGMTRRTVVIVLAALACLLLLLPFARVAVWDGSFPLTVRLVADEGIDTASLRFATCWWEEAADDLIRVRQASDRARASSDFQFHPADMEPDGAWTLSLPCSGRSGPYGLDYSH